MRYRLHGDPEHPFSEAVGVVASVKPGSDEAGTEREVVTIIDRRGRELEIPAPDLLAVKLFPLSAS